MKIKPRDIKRYNKIAEKGRKPIMVRVGHKWYTWYEGDPKHGVFLTTQSGRDVEFDFKQIDDIEEGVEKLTKSKLKEMIREEIQKLNEKTSDKEAAFAVLDYLKAAYKLSKKYPPGKWDYDISGIRGHPADLAMAGAERYWDGSVAKDLGIDRDMRNLRTAEQPNATKLIAKIVKKAEKNFKKMKESVNEDEKLDLKKPYGVFLRGGSIGSGRGQYIDRKTDAKLVATYDSESEAKGRAKRSNRRLSPGEKKYYGMKYTAIKMARAKLVKS